MTSTPDVPLTSRIVDDKSPVCIPFILERLRAHQAAHPGTPFFIGLNGVQGVGKTTLVRALATTLQQRELLPTLVLSIDDFYLPHAEQLALASAHPDNGLIQNRGEPGTHDVPLLASVLSALAESQPIHVPQYDKAAFSGLGDRVPASAWPQVNTLSSAPIRVVIVEGWCVGFRSLPAPAVEALWRASESRTLHNHKLEHLLWVNDALRAYDAALTDRLGCFIHVDAEDTEYVYDWRQQQEAMLRDERGSGMSDEQVVRFVDAYYPAYELYADGVRNGIFPDRTGCQLRLVVGKDRGVRDKIIM